MYGRHKDLGPSQDDHDALVLDPDYIKVKHEATSAVRRIVSQRAVVDEQMLEACFGLISTATVVGNFKEAKLHLQMLGRISSQISVSDFALMWLPLSNVKISVGLLERPVLPLLLKREPISEQELLWVAASDTTNMARLGSAFYALDLSEPLKSLLAVHARLCKLCEYNANNMGASSALLVAHVGKTGTILEFDMLAYPYDNETLFPRDQHDKPQLCALEAVVRLAALGMLSVAPYSILPGAGNGRAVTHHQKAALERFMRQSPVWTPEILKVICWALFVFVQNAHEQPEEAFFIELLAHLGSSSVFPHTWEEVEMLLFEYLYIPQLQASIFRNAWRRVLNVREQLRIYDTRQRP
jgi:hypothetical protein